MPGTAAAPDLQDTPLPPVEERRAQGRALRAAAPRSSHAGWRPAAIRRDPLALLAGIDAQGLAELVPMRYARMLGSPFTFLRGAAAVMAADLAATPSSGIRVQACGDSHLMNFGFYAAPDGGARFDINDFDETLPAPFEWDVKRLATSIMLAGREAELAPKLCAKAVRAAARAYRKGMFRLSRLDPVAAWEWHVDVRALVAAIDDPGLRRSEARRLSSAAATMPPYQDFPRLVGDDGGVWRIRDNPPLIFHFDRLRAARLPHAHEAFIRYRMTLPEERRVLFDRYRLVDIAFKVVGIGSVGTFCAIGLFRAGGDKPLFLQIKEAKASVLAPYAGDSAYANQGQRVVVGQRMMQAASDVFLGWTRDEPGAPGARHYYVRQLKDRKLAAMGEAMQRGALNFYAKLCGTTLARAHARSGDAAMIAGYLGSGEAFDAAILEFARDYADQSERDHAALAAAVRAGRIAARAELAG